MSETQETIDMLLWLKQDIVNWRERELMDKLITKLRKEKSNDD